MRCSTLLLLIVAVFVAVGSIYSNDALAAERFSPSPRGSQRGLLAPPARPLETLWSQFRGPANGRAFLPDAPKPPLRLVWTLDLTDPNRDGNTDDTCFGKDNQTDALGIAVRADEEYLYLFNVNNYKLANHVFKVRQRDGVLVARAEEERRCEPVSNRNCFQLIDAPWGTRVVFKGTFYRGVKMFKAADLTPIPEDTVHIKFRGHAQEGQRWGMGAYFLDGHGPATKGDAPVYYWGSTLRMRRADVTEPQEQRVVFNEHPKRSFPALAWQDGKMVMFTRVDFSTPSTAVPYFHEHRYAVVDINGNVLKDVTVEGLYKDLQSASRFNSGSDNNVVQAIAIVPDENAIYAHERPTALTQHIVRRSLEDFAVEGIIASLNTYSNGLWFNGKRRDGMALGFAVDDRHFYLHTRGELIAYDHMLTQVIWREAVRPRTLNAAVPYWSSYVPDYTKLPNRGTENTVAATDGYVYYTTDQTLEARRAEDGELVWLHVFTDLPRDGLPGDVLLAPEYVFVLTHTNQSKLYAFHTGS